jgi:hypothetical protein
VLPPVTLDAERSARLDVILARNGESYAAWVRRQIEEAPVHRERPSFSAGARRHGA